MSLILDALKKLEREKPSDGSGVVVVGSVPWGGRDRGRRVGLAAALIGLGAIALLGFWLLSSRRNAPSGGSAVAPPESARLPAPSARSGAPALVGTSAPPPSPPSPAADPSAAPRPVRSASRPETAVSLVPAPPPASSTEAAVPEAVPETTPARIELRLHAISVRDGRPIALLNDRLVREGDSFEGIRILRIGETEVEIEYRGQRQVIRF